MTTSPPSSALVACRHCGVAEPLHQDEHPRLCCDCFDLSLGMPVDALNRERATRGDPPLPPWPRRVLDEES